MTCSTCLNGIDHGARCTGSNCRAIVGACCDDGATLCLECRAAEAKGIWQRPWCPPDMDVVARLSGATVRGERVPLCSRTLTDAASCDCAEIDEANDARPD